MRAEILNRIGPRLDSVSEIGPDFRTVFRRFTKMSESFAYELRLERFSRLRVRIAEGNILQSKFVRKLEPTGVVVASLTRAPRRKTWIETKQGFEGGVPPNLSTRRFCMERYDAMP